MNRLEDIHSFLPLTDKIGTAGQPQAEQFAAIRDAGYGCVINLALANTTGALPDEAAVAAQHDLEYVHIPVEWTAPRVEDAEQFFATMREREGQKVFVHCAANMRVSAFLYLYRTLCLHEDEEPAMADMQRIWEPNETWQELIRAVRARHEPAG